MDTAERAGLRIAITGTSRGLGLEFVRQYLADGHRVFALARCPAESRELQDLGAEHGERLASITCDVGAHESMATAVTELGEATDAVDLLINNAGMYGARDGSLGDLDYPDIRRVFEVNTLGPLRMSELCVPLLRRGRQPRIAHVSSKMGSIADNGSGGAWAYRISKAALNMVAANLVHALSGDGIASLVLHPGWVRTDMGGGAAPLGIAASVRGMRQVIAGLDIEPSGGFFDYSGEPVPW